MKFTVSWKALVITRHNWQMQIFPKLSPQTDPYLTVNEYLDRSILIVAPPRVSDTESNLNIYKHRQPAAPRLLPPSSSSFLLQTWLSQGRGYYKEHSRGNCLNVPHEFASVSDYLRYSEFALVCSNLLQIWTGRGSVAATTFRCHLPAVPAISLPRVPNAINKQETIDDDLTCHFIMALWIYYIYFFVTLRIPVAVLPLSCPITNMLCTLLYLCVLAT